MYGRNVCNVRNTFAMLILFGDFFLNYSILEWLAKCQGCAIHFMEILAYTIIYEKIYF